MNISKTSLILGAFLALGCGCGGPPPVVDFMAAVDATAPLDDLRQDLAVAEPELWVEYYDPERSSPGFTLDLFRRRLPILVDPQGRIVHSWPQVRGVGRARLTPEGRLIVIGTDDVVKEYDWEGALTWAYRLPKPDGLPHHDVIRLANGNYLVLGLDSTSREDYLHEVDREGRVVWSWPQKPYLDEHFPDRDRSRLDPTHINSLFELGENRWFDDGDDRFQPGNILVSARNLNAIFIIDKASGEIIWIYREGLDHQHEASMIPEGRTGAGLIALFNNGLTDLHHYRLSEIRLIHPPSGQIHWSYADPTFFTPIVCAFEPSGRSRSSPTATFL